MAEKLDRLEKEKEKEKEQKKGETACSYALQTQFENFSIPSDGPQTPLRSTYRGHGLPVPPSRPYGLITPNRSHPPNQTLTSKQIEIL